MDVMSPHIDPREGELLKWLKAKAMDGYSAYKEEPNWNQIARNMDYVEGRQAVNRKLDRSVLVDNRVRRAVFTTVSSMTDVRPIWDYYTNNSTFKSQSEILNKLALGWWKDTFADRALQEGLKYASVAGSGFLYLSWNPELPGGGNLELLPLDPRDVIPIGHPTYGTSIQDWKGVLIRQRRAISWLKEKYPTKAHVLNPTGSWFFEDLRKRPQGGKVYAQVWDVLRSGMIDATSGDTVTDFMRIFIKDSSIHRGEEPVTLGRGNWAYTVFPVGFPNPSTGEPTTEEEAKLYPGGRLIVCTPNVLLDDIPNPYWHGKFPVIKLTLDPIPWSLLGISMVSELVGLQDDLNASLRGMSDNMKQHIKRNIIADRSALDRDSLDRMDSADFGWKLRTNPGASDAVRVIDAPTLPNYFLAFIEFLKGEIDDAAGIKDLQALLSLKQMPSPDTVQQFMEAMTPILKLRARVMEQSLSEIAELMKVNFFQFYDMKRRIRLLGVDGVTKSDILDYDPEQMVPALSEGDEGYTKDLDKGKDRIERARVHHQNFTFHVTPNTFLNVSHMQKKMMDLQLYREGVIPIWSLWDSMDTPNTGPTPPGSLPEQLKMQAQMGIGIPIPTMIQMQAQQAAQQAQLGGAMPPGGAPAGPGASLGGGREGRPPSGQAPPKMETRNNPDGSQRTLISESK